MKLEIQRKLRQELGIIVNCPKQGGLGNSNSGNTARVLLREKEKVSQLIEDKNVFPMELMERPHTVLQRHVWVGDISWTPRPFHALSSLGVQITPSTWVLVRGGTRKHCRSFINMAELKATFYNVLNALKIPKLTLNL